MDFWDDEEYPFPLYGRTVEPIQAPSGPVVRLESRPTFLVRLNSQPTFTVRINSNPNHS